MVPYLTCHLCMHQDNYHSLFCDLEQEPQIFPGTHGQPSVIPSASDSCFTFCIHSSYDSITEIFCGDVLGPPEA